MSSHRSAATKLKGLEKDGEIEKDGVGEATVAVFAPSISFGLMASGSPRNISLRLY